MLGFSVLLTGLGLLAPSGVVRFQVPVSEYLVQFAIIGVVGALMMPVVGRVSQRLGRGYP